MTTDGEVPISEIKIGDSVLAYDESSGTTSEHEVTAVHAHTDDTLVYLTIDGEEVETTPEHPFYTLEHGWTPAGELQVDDTILSLGGDYGTVESITVVDQSETMYSLTVAEAHTFFVGDGQWLVHNVCKIPKNALGNVADTEAEALTHNIESLANYEPGDHTFFSGVYDLNTNKWLAYPSGKLSFL